MICATTFAVFVLIWVSVSFSAPPYHDWIDNLFVTGIICACLGGFIGIFTLMVHYLP